ncbi:MAG: Gfo/Idh/MocA family oxidoreductase [Bauldia litoralis]
MTSEPLRFALVGAAGYVAPRHLRAIKDTGNQLVAALDPHDNVGIMDSYFPEAEFFTEFERFDRAIDKARRRDAAIDYVSICSPNHLHDAHIRLALRSRAHAICEKPLVLNPWNVDALAEIEAEGEHRINTILQLRLHPTIRALKERVESQPADTMLDVDLTYITSRGRWYHVSWKGDQSRSGGIATNIGIHFFDMLCFVFGSPKLVQVHAHTPTMAAGFLQFDHARVRWFLSIDFHDLPAAARQAGKSTYRSVRISDEDLEFSEGFTDLHTASYTEILAGNGFGLEDARQSIEVAFEIRNAQQLGLKGDFHPQLRPALAARGETVA